MKMTERGILLVLSGPSGTGKGTVARRFVEQYERVKFSVSATTRAPREGEGPGHYDFITREAFVAKIELGSFLEYAEYNGNYYGTPEEAVDRMLSAGFDVLLEIEQQGALQVKRKRPDAILVFLLPPSMAELEQRLRGRATESEEQVRARMEIARHELHMAQEYNYIPTNHTVDETVAQMAAITAAEHLRTDRRISMVERLIQER